MSHQPNPSSLPKKASGADPDQPWQLTAHLLERAAERDIRIDQIRRIVDCPEITYPQPRHGAGRQMRQRGGLAVVVDEGTHSVVTVLFRDPAAWAARGFSGDRS